MSYRPDREEAALLILKALHKRTEALDKKITRAVITQKSLKRLICRARLDSRFVQEVGDELLDFGWVLSPTLSGNYVLFKEDVALRWTRLTSMAIRGTLRKLRLGKFDFDEERVQYEQDDDGEEDE